MVTVELAGITVGIDNRFKYVEHLVRDYLTDKAPEFTVCASDEEIERERIQSGPEFPNGYLESVVVYRAIAERLPSYDAFVFHGAVLSLDGLGYAFTARSGVGKTTHTRLWLKHFGERCHYVNGDKPIIRFIDGIPYAYGTPWMGKENYGVNERAPLAGIAFLERGETNRARPIAADLVSTKLLSQMYVPKNRLAALMLLSLCDCLLGTVKLIELKCNMEPDAPVVSAAAFGVNE